MAAISPCLTVARAIKNSLPSITEKTLPEEYEVSWSASPGRRFSFSCANLMGVHPLITCIMRSNLLLARHIYTKSPKALNTGDQWGWTPIFYAVRHRKLAFVKELLDLGVLVNAASIGKRTIEDIVVPAGVNCLWIAAELINDIAMIMLLLRHDAEIPPDLEKNQHIQKAQEELRIEFKVSLQDFLPSLPNVLLTEVLKYVI